MQKEAVAIANSIAAAVEAILVVVIAFGVELTGEQVAGITAAIIAVGQTVATFVARRNVFSQSTVDEVVANVVSGVEAGDI